MPNKIAMGSSGVAVSGVAVWVMGRGVGRHAGVHGPSVQQPQHGQGSTLPTDKGAAKHREDAPGDESSPAGTGAEDWWDRANPQ